VPPQGREAAATSPAVKEGGGPLGAAAPCPSSSLDKLDTVEDLSSLEMTAKGEKNKVSGQYVVLEASPEPSDQNPRIQGLLETSRIFMVTPKNTPLVGKGL
jgi:hypothetical protein